MALFEWIGPLIELVGYGFMLAGFAFGAVSYAALAAFLLVAIGMGILLSVNGLLLETMSFRVYSRRRDMLQLFLMAVLENFGYRQLNTLWRCRGLWQWFSRRKHQWGVMRRSGQWGQSWLNAQKTVGWITLHRSTMAVQLGGCKGDIHPSDAVRAESRSP